MERAERDTGTATLKHRSNLKVAPSLPMRILIEELLAICQETFPRCVDQQDSQVAPDAWNVSKPLYTLPWKICQVQIQHFQFAQPLAWAVREVATVVGIQFAVSTASKETNPPSAPLSSHQ
jgi:hypothetical protein